MLHTAREMMVVVDALKKKVTQLIILEDSDEVDEVKEKELKDAIVSLASQIANDKS